MEKVAYTLGFENDHTIAMTVSKKYRGLAIELRRQMIKDLECKTHTEKILVDAVISAYIRTLRYSEAMTAMIDFDNSLWPEKTNFLSMIGKELDRANRHLLTSYQVLIQLKQPPLKVQVKANNVFIGQAQQFNSMWIKRRSLSMSKSLPLNDFGTSTVVSENCQQISVHDVLRQYQE